MGPHATRSSAVPTGVPKLVGDHPLAVAGAAIWADSLSSEVSLETLRTWVKRTEVEEGARSGLSEDGRIELRELRRKVRHLEQERDAVFDYIEVFCNRARRHSTIGDVSPAEFEGSYVRAITS